jgi:hypothetical protein
MDVSRRQFWCKIPPVRLVPSLLALTLAPALVAQAPARATAIGTVYDSVRLRPLAGALIRVDTSEVMAIADGDGRFRIDGIPPGQHYLRVEAPILDTLGIALRSPSLNFAAGDAKVAELAIPASEALVMRLCSSAWRARGPAALMGRIREADTGKPAVGAKVSLLWFEIESQMPLRRAPRVREATVTADGTYRICGLPAELDGKAQVIRGNLTSGDVPISFGLDILALRSMSIAAAEALVVDTTPTRQDSAGVPAPPAPPRRVGSARLAGRVTNKAGQPIAGARIQVDGTTRSVETRANGEFFLDSLPPGTQNVTVRKLGFAPTEEAVDLSSLETSRVQVSMADFVPMLETVRVSAQRERGLNDVGFARRKRIASGWFVEGDEIANKNALNFSDVLRTAPGIAVQRSGNKQYLANSRDPMNGCVNIWIDGTQWQQIEPGDIDDFVKPWELAAIEVYGATTTPAEYSSGGRGNCSTVVVWTVRRLDRKRP